MTLPDMSREDWMLVIISLEVYAEKMRTRGDEVNASKADKLRSRVLRGGRLGAEGED